MEEIVILERNLENLESSVTLLLINLNIDTVNSKVFRSSKLTHLVKFKVKGTEKVYYHCFWYCILFFRLKV